MAFEVNDNGSEPDFTTHRAGATTVGSAVFAGIGICAAIAGYLAWYVALPREGLRVVALDVGQGDAVYIRTPSGYDVLVDGGPDAAVLDALSEQMPWFDRTIDLVVATHSDADHIGGLIHLVSLYRVEAFAATGAHRDTQMRAALDRALAHEVSIDGMVRTSVTAGDSISIDARAGVWLDVLSPQVPDGRYGFASTTDSNDLSVVLRLRYGSTTALLTGDIGETVERALVACHPTMIRADLLKAAHHGSNSSSDPTFLSAVAPRLVVLSVGQGNRYGHPHPDAVARLASSTASTSIYMTKDEGSVAFVSDGILFRREPP